MNAVEVRKLKKRFPHFAMNEVNFTLPQGYIMGLVGANGAGKTTLIKLLLGLYLPDGGDIKVLGGDPVKEGKIVRDSIGYIFDDPKYYDFRLKKVIKIISPFYSRWDQKVYSSFLEKFDLSEKMRFKTLSRGMKLKFSLAVALSHHARFLILDEPTSGLDPIFRIEFLNLLQDIMMDETMTILFSSHITADIEKVADYVTYIKDGRILFSEEKQSLRDKFLLVKGADDILTNKLSGKALGIKRSPYCTEALLLANHNLEKCWEEEAVPTLEQIMFFHERGHDHVNSLNH